MHASGRSEVQQQRLVIIDPKFLHQPVYVNRDKFLSFNIVAIMRKTISTSRFRKYFVELNLTEKSY